jgi:hypothetical protein
VPAHSNRPGREPSGGQGKTEAEASLPPQRTTVIEVLTNAAIYLRREGPQEVQADPAVKWRVLGNLLDVAKDVKNIRGDEGLVEFLKGNLGGDLVALGFDVTILDDVVASLGAGLVGAVLDALNRRDEGPPAASERDLGGDSSTRSPRPAIEVDADDEDDPEEPAVPAPRRHYPDPLGQSAYHGPLGEMVRLIEPHTEADPVAVLIQALAYFGNLIGRGPHLLAEARRHHTNIFVCIVGATAKGRKGSSQGQVERPFREVDEVWLKDRVTTGLSSGEGLIWSVRDPIERSEPIKEKGRVIEYQTVIADPGIADKRVLFAEEEFSGVLAVMVRQGNSLSPTIRKAWDSGNLNTVVKNNPAKATDAHVSITGHTTKDELLRNLADTEMANGFANRILWVCARRSKLLPFGGSLRDEDLRPVIRQIKGAVDFARQIGETRLAWSPGAAALWRVVYPELSAGKPGLFGAVTSRAEAQTIRLALIYALADCSREIEQAHLEAALAIWRYAEASARFIFGDALGDPLADELLQLLRRAQGQGLTRNDIREAFGRNKASEEITRALTALSEAGLARSRPAGREPGRKGRTAEVWYASETAGGYAVDAINAVMPAPGTPITASTASMAYPEQACGVLESIEAGGIPVLARPTPEVRI